MRASGGNPSASMRAGADAGAWRSFAIAGLAVVLTQVGFSLTLAPLPLYLRDLGAARGRIGLEVGAGSLAAVLGMFALGPALNRRGPRPFLALGAALCLVADLAMLAVPAEAAVTLFRVLQGIGTALVIPSASTLVVGLFPTRPATALGLMNSLNSLAMACGPPVGLALYDARGATGLFLPAAFLAALGLGATCLLPRGRPAHRARGFGFDRAWLPLFVASAFGVIYYGAAVAYLSLHLREIGGPNAGIFFAADNLGSFLLRGLSGVLVDRIGSRWPKVIGAALTVPGVMLLALSPSTLTLAAAGALTGAGAGLLLSAIMADLARLSGAANRGTALALGSASINAASFAGSAISGVLFTVGGFDAVVTFSAVMTLAAVPFALVPRRSDLSAA